MEGSDQGLHGLAVVDLGLGMAAALVAKFLREAGADITRVEPVQGDPFYEVYPAYSVWRQGLRIEREASPAGGRIDELLGRADICIVGGEDYPGVERRHSAAALQSRYPRLVDPRHRGLSVGNGARWPSGHRCTRPGAFRVVLRALQQAPVAHELRAVELWRGAARLVRTLCRLVAARVHGEGARSCRPRSTRARSPGRMLLWCEMDKPTPATQFVMPKDPWPLIFRCADGVYVQVVLGSTGSKGRLYQILRIDDPTVDINDSGMPKPTADAKNFFGDIDVLARHVETWQSRALLEAIWAAGLPAEPVLPPGGCWDDPQVKHNGIIVRDCGRHAIDRSSAVSATLSGAAHVRCRRDARTPLAGVKVIDFGAFVAGPYTSTVLADFGADVIKVEPLTGDPNRSIFRSWTSSNRGKRCLTIDLEDARGLKIAQQLCVAADVVTSNFRPGVSARLGIDAKTLHGLKPEPDRARKRGVRHHRSARRRRRLRHVLPGALRSRLARRAASAIRRCGTARRWSTSPRARLAPSACCSTCISAHAPAQGAELGAGLLNAGLFLLSELVQRADGQFEGAPPLNTRQTGYHPAEQLYEATDGWLAIAARDDAMAQRLLDVLGLDGVDHGTSSDGRLTRRPDRRRHSSTSGDRALRRHCRAPASGPRPAVPMASATACDDADLERLGIVYQLRASAISASCNRSVRSCGCRQQRPQRGARAVAGRAHRRDPAASSATPRPIPPACASARSSSRRDPGIRWISAADRESSDHRPRRRAECAACAVGDVAQQPRAGPRQRAGAGPRQARRCGAGAPGRGLRIAAGPACRVRPSLRGTARPQARGLAARSGGKSPTAEGPATRAGRPRSSSARRPRPRSSRHCSRRCRRSPSETQDLAPAR